MRIEEAIRLLRQGKRVEALADADRWIPFEVSDIGVVSELMRMEFRIAVLEPKMRDILAMIHEVSQAPTEQLTASVSTDMTMVQLRDKLIDYCGNLPKYPTLNAER